MPSSETIIPRGQQSAWQRWELASLGAAPDPVHTEAATAALLAAERAAAVAEGRVAGYAQGRADAAGEQARLGALVTALTHSVAEREQDLVDEVLDLAIVLARQLVGDALAVKRELVLPVVSAALRELPHATQRIEIAVHPSDLPVVQAYIAAEALGEFCRFTADAAILPGGCRVATEQCDIDATVEARWKRLLVAVGRTGAWIESSSVGERA
ncbi:MAG: flagellar assembly protein FliH [Casimicrobiaceae bacterium]